MTYLSVSRHHSVNKNLMKIFSIQMLQFGRLSLGGKTLSLDGIF